MPLAPFIVSMSPPDYPLAWLRPRSAASVSPGMIIVAPPRPSASTSGCAVTQDLSPIAREPARAKPRKATNFGFADPNNRNGG
jgi:hypothetical protein